MTPRLLPRQAQEKMNCVDTDTAKGLLKQAQGANFTQYDFREGFSRRLRPFGGELEIEDWKLEILNLHFPICNFQFERSEELLSQAIVLGFFPDSLDCLGREGRLVGEALELWLKERKKREDHAQAKEDAARL